MPKIKNWSKEKDVPATESRNHGLDGQFARWQNERTEDTIELSYQPYESDERPYVMFAYDSSGDEYEYFHNRMYSTVKDARKDALRLMRNSQQGISE